MSPLRMWKVLRKDLALGPRSPLFLYTIILPFALTVILQLAFSTLLLPRPRLAIVDEGNSTVTATIARMEGIEITQLGNVEALRSHVEAADFDAGLFLPSGFDDAVRHGEHPPLSLFFAGESYASNRIVLQVAVLDALRALPGTAAPVEVGVVTLGEATTPLSLRLVPVIVFYVLAMAGIFVPGSSLVEERERGTLMAIAVTPTRTSEVLAAKWALGVVFASVMSAMTLLLNRAMGPRPWEVFVVVLVAAALTSALGLLVGVVSKSSAGLFGLIKAVGLLLFAPALFYLFPDWPQWIARIFPLYWVIEPIWSVSVLGNPLSDVRLELGVALAATVLLLTAVMRLASRMQTRMAAQ